MKKFILFVLFLGHIDLAVSSGAENCREIYVKDARYCSVSFYELLGDDSRYDGVNIRVVGYLKFQDNRTAFSVDTVSLKGTMILDNVIAVDAGEEHLKQFRDGEVHLVVIYGQYRSQSDRYTMARGELTNIIIIEPHI